MSQKIEWNTPNKLSILRIILSLVILIFMLPIRLPWAFLAGWNSFVEGTGFLIACLIFLFASYTDYLDGHLARKKDQVSVFGQFVDPIGDKLLVLSVLTAFVELGRVTSFVPVIVLLREFMVTGLRLMAISKGKVIAASPFGKFKTVSQYLAIFLLFAEGLALRYIGEFQFAHVLGILANIILIAAVILTILSGYDYFKKNRGVMVNT